MNWMMLLRAISPSATLNSTSNAYVGHHGERERRASERARAGDRTIRAAAERDARGHDAATTDCGGVAGLGSPRFLLAEQRALWKVPAGSSPPPLPQCLAWGKAGLPAAFPLVIIIAILLLQPGPLDDCSERLSERAWLAGE